MNAAVGEIKKLNESLSQLRQENIVLKVCSLVSYWSSIFFFSRSFLTFEGALEGPLPLLGGGRYKLLRAFQRQN